MIARVLSCMVLAVALMSAQNPPARVAWWAGSMDAAFAEAKTRNVPVLIALIQDGEEANERMVTGLFADPAYIKATRGAVAIVADREPHPGKKEDSGGQIRTTCSKFGATTCEAHQAAEMLARSKFIDGPVQTPQQMVVLPDGTVVDHLVDLHAADDYAALLKKAQKKLGKGLTNDQFAEVKKSIALAKVALAKPDPAATLKAAKAALAVATGTPLAKIAGDLIAEMDVAARSELDAARAAAAAGDPLLALQKLDAAIATYDGSEVVVDLKKEQAKIKGSKAGADAARTLARDAKGRPAMEAADAALKQKDYVRAKRELDQVRKVAPDTPIAAEAQKKIDALMADPDIRPLLERGDREAAADRAWKDVELLLKDQDKAKSKQALTAFIAAWPGSKAAAIAKKKLEEIP